MMFERAEWTVIAIGILIACWWGTIHLHNKDRAAIAACETAQGSFNFSTMECDTSEGADHPFVSFPGRSGARKALMWGTVALTVGFLMVLWLIVRWVRETL